jgi:hypothetical protein
LAFDVALATSILNTELLKQGLTVMQVQGVTGHKSIGMPERYNHLEASQITEVMKAQEVIAGMKKEKPPIENGKPKIKHDLKIVKMPVRKSA